MIIQTFLIAFLISYLGSIPPGTINVTVMQFVILKQRSSAIFLALSASLVEFVYAGVAVKFHTFIVGSSTLIGYFQVITSVTLIGLGLWYIISKNKVISNPFKPKFSKQHGLMKGVILGMLNPMAIPFWLVITTYLKSEYLVTIGKLGYWIYLLGISLGTFALLLSIVMIEKRFDGISKNVLWIRKVPGFILICMGIYYLLNFLTNS